MALNFKIDIIEKGKGAPRYKYTSDQDGARTLEDMLLQLKTTLVITSRDVLKEELRDGFDPNYLTITDNKAGRPIELVKPVGKIQFVARADLAESILLVYDAIEQRGVKGQTGQYQRSNYVFLNGKQVANSRGNLEAWLKTNPEFGPRDRVRFVNLTPYARKLERYSRTSSGKGADRKRKSYDGKKRSGPLIRAANGAYFLASRVAKRRLKKNVRVAFGYVPGKEFSAVPTTVNNQGKRNRTTYKKSGDPYLYPTITIYTGDAKGIL